MNTKVCYNNLSTREFLILQKRIFPIYFASQIGLGVLTAVTHPPYSIISLVKDFWAVAPLGVVITMGSLNYFVFGPKTTKAAFIKNALKGKYLLLFFYWGIPVEFN